MLADRLDMDLDWVWFNDEVRRGSGAGGGSEGADC